MFCRWWERTRCVLLQVETSAWSNDSPSSPHSRSTSKTRYVCICPRRYQTITSYVWRYVYVCVCLHMRSTYQTSYVCKCHRMCVSSLKLSFRTRSFLEAGFRPCNPLLFWFVPWSRTKRVIWICTRTRLRSQQPVPSWLPSSRPGRCQEDFSAVSRIRSRCLHIIHSLPSTSLSEETTRCHHRTVARRIRLDSSSHVSMCFLN